MFRQTWTLLLAACLLLLAAASASVGVTASEAANSRSKLSAATASASVVSRGVEDEELLVREQNIIMAVAKNEMTARPDIVIMTGLTDADARRHVIGFIW